MSTAKSNTEPSQKEEEGESDPGPPGVDNPEDEPVQEASKDSKSDGKDVDGEHVSYFQSCLRSVGFVLEIVRSSRKMIVFSRVSGMSGKCVRKMLEKFGIFCNVSEIYLLDLADTLMSIPLLICKTLLTVKVPVV